MRLTRRHIKYAFLIALVVFAVPRLTTWFPFTFPFHHPEQDECSFGPVTNVEYRAMLAKARSLQRWTWITDSTTFTMEHEILSKQFSKVSGNSSSPYVKIAAMHAIFRALGADFRNANDFGGADHVFSTHQSVTYHYSLSVPRIGVVAIVPGNAWLVGALNGPPRTGDWYTAKHYPKGRLSLITHFPNLIDPIPSHAFRRGSTSCPPVPSIDLQEFYTSDEGTPQITGQ